MRPRRIWSWIPPIVDSVAVFAGLGALFLLGWWAFILAISLALVVRALVLWTAPLQVVTVEDVRSSRKRQRWGVASLFVALLLLAIYGTLAG